MGKLWKWLLAFSRDTAVGLFLTQFILPTAGAAAVSALAVVRGEVPLWAALTVGAFVLWALAAAANNFTAMTHRGSAEFRLSVRAPTVGLKADPATGKFEGAQLGLTLFNTASFPLEYEMQSIRSQVGGRVNEAPNYENRGTVLHPFQEAMFQDDLIRFTDDMYGRELKTSLDVSIRYRRAGGRKWHLLTFSAKGRGIVSQPPGPVGFNWSY